MCKWTMYKRARIPMFSWERRACANSGAQAVFPRPRKNGLGTRLGLHIPSRRALHRDGRPGGHSGGRQCAHLWRPTRAKNCKYKKALRGGVRACNNRPQPNPYILVFGDCRRLLHALTPPRSAFLYLQFLARCHPYILLHFLYLYIINPRRACAARVTVVVVFVCHSVCYARTHFSSHRTCQKQAHIPSGGRRSENMWDFL